VTAAMKSRFTERARRINAAAKATIQSQPEPTPAELGHVDGTKGHFGLADDHYMISKHILSEAAQTKSFVKNSDARWRAAHSHVLPDQPLENLPGSSYVHAPCTSFCKSSVTPAGVQVRNHLVNIARLLRAENRVSKGHVSLQSRKPLLLLKQGSSIHAWMIANACFSPLEVDLWKCSFAFPMCTLLFEEIPIPFGTSLKVPMLINCHEAAMTLSNIIEAGGITEWQLTSKYTASSLDNSNKNRPTHEQTNNQSTNQPIKHRQTNNPTTSNTALLQS
jgi:hypothetical protein